MVPQLGALLVVFVSGAAAATTSTAPVLSVSTTAPSSVGLPVFESFLSYSIEFSSLPDYAGNLTRPNTYSDNLLNVLGSYQGTKPIIRVGGNTQDYATYNPKLKVATNGTYTDSSRDYPSILQIGKPYYESFQTWNNTQFTYGFNFGINNSTGQYTLNATAPLACQALQNGKLLYWEMGNEPDLFSRNLVRPMNWKEPDYVKEWLSNTSTLKALVSKACPKEPFGLIAPSLASLKGTLDPIRIFQDGLNSKGDVKIFSSHQYMSGATSPGVTLQKTLMNHTNIIHVVEPHVNVSKQISKYGIPFIMGETNSLYNEGAPGLSDSFGAALWLVDYALWCASQGIRRIHLHMGTDYRYQAWQPVQTSKTAIATRPPFYGNTAVTSILGDLRGANTSVANLAFPGGSPTDAAYAVYKNGQLQRIAVVNLASYNYTVPTPGGRSAVKYQFAVPSAKKGHVKIQRLYANGSDAISGITWDGWSYAYNLKQGQPVRMNNVTINEQATVDSSGIVSVTVPYSSVAALNFESGYY